MDLVTASTLDLKRPFCSQPAQTARAPLQQIVNDVARRALPSADPTHETPPPARPNFWDLPFQGAFVPPPVAPQAATEPTLPEPGFTTDVARACAEKGYAELLTLGIVSTDERTTTSARRALPITDLTCTVLSFSADF